MGLIRIYAKMFAQAYST